MTEWEPATEAEAAMRDALRANDQELYFRILARTELLLPVSAEALAGQAPMGWGTWTTGGRTHVLAFTSPAALRASLGENGGTSRRSAYHDLAAGWPNHEWWLAVNPGLPIEGYLPAWFVSQLSRGDVRLPGRTLGARARLERAEYLARTRAAVTDPAAPSEAAPVRPAPAAPPAPAYAPPRPPVATPPRRVTADPAAEATEAIRLPPRDPDRPTDAPVSPGGDATEPISGWLTNPRRPTPAPPDRTDPGTAPTENRPAGTGTRNSFFEPSPPGRSAGPAPISPFRAQDRAAPTSRLGEPGRAFPRRRPYRPGQPGEDPTQAFRFTEPTPAEQPTPARSAPPAPGAEPTQALPRRQPPGEPSAAEPTQALPRRVPPPQAVAEPTQALPRRGQPVSGEPTGQETTQPIPGPASTPPPPVAPVSHAAQPGYAPAADQSGYAASEPPPRYAASEPSPGYAASEPPSGYVATEPSPGYAASEPAGFDPGVGTTGYPAAEPVPVPPSSHRDPSPIVIEGTVVESRDLADPTAAYQLDPDRTAAYQREPESSYASTGGPAGPDGPASDGPGPADVEPTVDFHPANDVEEELLGAAGTGSTDTFLSTLLLARVLLPVAVDSAPGARPGENGFVWQTVQLDGETYVVVYTSAERLADHVDRPVETVQVKFVQLIRRWPDPQWSFAVNPGTPVGAKLPGEQIVALANWAAEVGLGDDVEPEPVEPSAPAEETASRIRYAVVPEDPNRPPTMQKAVAPSQLAYYLERGYDRVSGFVHRAAEVAHLNTPAKLHAALGLGYPESPFSPDADEIYLLRWPAYRPSLYRIPYGGQNESAMRAMEGWVIERPPFRGNGFAPGESSDVIAEFKVDSARLPHGAQLWRVGADGDERVIAILDGDALLWRQVGEQ